MRHWPFPQKDWLYNAPILGAIRTYYKAVRAFGKDSREWTPDDNDLFVAVVNAYGQ
ncbi:MAG: hypothetical protein OT477_14825 [Chloroflexi bacterium]|nr:hypothetical protein [Chloroflexota bacterium]